MVKIFLGGIIILSCTLFGKKYTSQYYLKLKYFECLAELNLQLKQNLMFKHDNLLNILYSPPYSSDFNTTLDSFKLYKSNNLIAIDLYFPYWANDDDKQFITNYFLSLGKGNRDSEMENIIYYENIISEKLKKISDKSSKFSSLGQKLGFAVGMAIFVIIL